MCRMMETPRRRRRALATLSLILWVSSELWGQDRSGNSAPGTANDVSGRLEDLQRQVDQLQAELALLRKQIREPGKTAAVPAGAAASWQAPANDAPAPAVAPTAAPNWRGSTSLTGLVDGYYGYNFNQPHNRTSSLRAFDGPTNQFGLNLVELILDRPPPAKNSRLGYHVAFGFGQAMNVLNGSDPGGPGFAQYLKEAYFSYLAPVGRGLQVDFGKFVTPHGAEVIESKANWNYSRGLLFTYAVPFYHFGLRARYAFTEKYAATGYFVNGWNDIVDNNTGKTVGMGFAWTPTKRFGITQNYMAGPEQPGINRNWRQLSDTVVSFSPTDRLSLMVNYDYGRGDRLSPASTPVFWTGVAAYARYVFNDRYAIATRYEYYNDHDGFTTGTPQHLNGLTGTLERRIASRLITRLEYRRDSSNRPAFFKGDTPARSQSTVAGGLMYEFDLLGTQ